MKAGVIKARAQDVRHAAYPPEPAPAAGEALVPGRACAVNQLALGRGFKRSEIGESP